MKCIYKIVYRNTISYAVQNRKGPAEAEPEIFSKNANDYEMDCLACNVIPASVLVSPS